MYCIRMLQRLILASQNLVSTMEFARLGAMNLHATVKRDSSERDARVSTISCKLISDPVSAELLTLCHI